MVDQQTQDLGTVLGSSKDFLGLGLGLGSLSSGRRSTMTLTIMQCCEDLLNSTEMKGNWLNPVPVTVNSVGSGVTVCTNTVCSGTSAVATLSPVPVPVGI